MSTYPTNDPVSPTTPIFDETVTATSVHVDDTGRSTSPDTSRSEQAADTAKDAAGKAADTAKETAGQAKEQAQHVGAAAADAGRQVGSTAKDQASRVASDAVGQARELYGQATEQLSEQAGKQQKNLASTLHTFGADLSKMHGQDAGGGLAAELVQTLSQRAGDFAGWLDDRDPGEVFDEVRQFAARRPGLFIGLAAVSGIVAARAVKALSADAKSPERTTPLTGSTTGSTDFGGQSTYPAAGTADLGVQGTYPTSTGDFL